MAKELFHLIGHGICEPGFCLGRRAVAVRNGDGGHASCFARHDIALIVTNVNAVIRREAGFLGGIQEWGRMGLGLTDSVTTNGDGTFAIESQVAHDGQRQMLDFIGYDTPLKPVVFQGGQQFRDTREKPGQHCHPLGIGR